MRWGDGQVLCAARQAWVDVPYALEANTGWVGTWEGFSLLLASMCSPHVVRIDEVSPFFYALPMTRVSTRVGDTPRLGRGWGFWRTVMRSMRS